MHYYYFTIAFVLNLSHKINKSAVASYMTMQTAGPVAIIVSINIPLTAWFTAAEPVAGSSVDDVKQQLLSLQQLGVH